MFEHFGQLWNDMIAHPGASLAIIGNLILIESLLSVDNAAVLATMVLGLPKDQRGKALKYGIIGAYFFRGLCLIFAAWLIQIWWLKPVGGLYLLYLTFDYFKGKKTPESEDDLLDTKTHWLYRATVGWMGQFWATVALVELMDLAFSIDNVFAAVAFTDNILLVWIGVFIGILAMRFVAQGFVRLMERFPFLETAAFIVIAILGLKLVLSLYSNFYPCSGFAIFLEGHDACNASKGIARVPGHHETVYGDIFTSVLTIAIFLIPIITSALFNWPRKHAVSEETND